MGTERRGQVQDTLAAEPAVSAEGADVWGEEKTGVKGKSQVFSVNTWAGDDVIH